LKDIDIVYVKHMAEKQNTFIDDKKNMSWSPNGSSTHFIFNPRSKQSQ